MYYVYILRSWDNLSGYVGMSENVLNRLNEHNSGRVKSTKNKKPWSIIFTASFQTRQEARKKEKYLKSAAGRRFRKKLVTMSP